MGEEQHEIYERIPWEAIETPTSDRRWMVYAVAGAITLGSLAYSVASGRQAPMAPEASTPGGTILEAVPTTAAGTVMTPAVPPVTATSISPMSVAEADLMAVEPEALLEEVKSLAERFAYEYVGFDGSQAATSELRALLPSDVPMPESPEGAQVWVDWARVSQASPVGGGRFHVDVIVRSLLSSSGAGFERLPTRVLTLEIGFGADGSAQVTTAPALNELVSGSPALTWVDVEMVEGLDGVVRPQLPTGSAQP